MSAAYQAVNIKAPFNTATGDDFSSRKFTCTTTHAADAIPKSWQGKYVRITSVTGNTYYGFSTRSGAEIDRSVSATAAGASGKVGDYLPESQALHDRIPTAGAPDTDVYFVREGDNASGVVVIRLASE
jgi:hypothetical protein